MAASVPEVHEGVVDGIPAFWVDTPPPITVLLTFRVGIWDEILLDRGITHLVEHLAMYELRGVEHPCNGLTGGNATGAWASGTPDQLRTFFGTLGRQIRELPLDRLETEVKVLKAEAQQRPFDFPSYYAEVFFGPNGPGVQGAPERGLDILAPREIQAWADRFCVRENAVLVFGGKPLETLDLDLPQGAYQPYSLPGPELGYRPRRLEFGGAQAQGICLGALTPRTTEMVMALEVLAPRLKERLRHELGLVYSVEPSYLVLDEDTAYVFLGADTPPDQVHETAAAFFAVVRELYDAPPTEDEVARARRTGLDPEQVEETALARSELHRAAFDRLLRYPHDTLPEIVAEREAATPDSIHRAFRAAIDRGMLWSPRFEGLEVPPREPRTCDPVEGVRFKPKRSSPSSIERILVGADGISGYGDGRWVTLPWADLVMADRTDPAGWRLLGRNGAWLWLAEADWRRRRKLVKLLEASVPDRVRWPQPRRG